MMFREVKRKVARQIAWLAIGNRQDDRYIAAYPRSGSTWTRTVLVNLMKPAEAAQDPHLFNDVIPGVTLETVSKVRALSSPRLMSSHTKYRRKIRKAIYLLRDGRDVLVSYYHYLVTRRGGKQSFEEFFESYCQHKYGQRWDENVESWLRIGKAELGERCMIVQFESLKADTETQFSRMAEFLHIPAPLDQLERAIEAASLERRREIEQQLNPEVDDSDACFYRQGTTGQWEDYMTPSIEGRFLELSSTALKLGGYM